MIQLRTSQCAQLLKELDKEGSAIDYHGGLPLWEEAESRLVNVVCRWLDQLGLEVIHDT